MNYFGNIYFKFWEFYNFIFGNLFLVNSEILGLGFNYKYCDCCIVW